MASVPLLSRLRVPVRGVGLPQPSRRLLGFALLATSLLGGLFLWLRDSPVVAVEEVAVRGATGPGAPQVRAALTEAARSMTTLHVDMQALREAAGDPSVDHLRVDRDLPDALTITVVERRPVAALTTGKRSLAVAADGTLLPGRSTAGLATIPSATLPSEQRLGRGAQRAAVAVLAAMPGPLRERARRAERRERGWAVELRDGPVVHLGSGARLRAKWTAAAAILANPAAQGAAYVDVRLPERSTAGGLVPLAVADGDQEGPAPEVPTEAQ